MKYAERGILDISDKRLLTRSALVTMLCDCGYDVEEILAVPVPFEAVLKGRLGRALTRLSAVFARLWPTLFGFPFLIVCRPRPSVTQVLAWSERCHVSERGPLGDGDLAPAASAQTVPRSQPNHHR